jgi:WD40 repeat protein
MGALLLILTFLAPQDPQPRDLHGDPLPPDAVARLGPLRFGHYRSIYGNAISADGKTLATGGCDESIRIWDVPSGKLRRVIDTRRTFVIALTADGSMMASASSHDKLTRIHETATGRELGTIDGEGNSLSFSPDGTSLALAFGRKLPVRIYDTGTFKLVRELPEESTASHGTVVFFDGGRRLATAGKDKTLRIWNADNGEELRAASLEFPAYKVIASPDSKMLAVTAIGNFDTPLGEDASAIVLFDPESGKESGRFTGHNDMVLALSFASDSRHLVTAGKDKIIRLWDVNSKAALKTFAGHDGRISGVHFLAGNNLVATTSDDCTIRLWDVKTGKERPVRPNATALAWDLAWSPDGGSIVTVDGEGRVRIWEALTGKELASIKGHDGRIRSVAWSPDGSRIATAGDDGTVRFWDPATGKSLRVIGAGGGAATSLAFSPDGAWLAGTGVGFISSWNAATGDRRFQHAMPGIGGDMDKNPIVAYSPDERAIAVSAEQSLRVFDAADGKELLRGRGSDLAGVTFLPGRDFALAFPAQSRLLAILESDRPWSELDRPDAAKELVFYRHNNIGNPPDLADRGLRLSFHEYTKDFRYSDYAWGLKGIAASPDGRYLATGSSDGTMRIFESLTGSEVKRLKWHYGSTDRADFSPDGTYLASLSWGECYAMVWNLRPRAEYRLADFEKHWVALAGGNGTAAYESAASLAAGGDSVVPELRARLFAKVDAKDASRLAADLDHEELDRREAATRGLHKLGIHALPAIRTSLGGKPSAEARRRMKELLADYESTVLTDAEAIRRLRSLMVLERIATGQAAKVLEALAQESPSNRERRDAAAALTRLRGK